MWNMKRWGKQQAAGWAKANKEDQIQKRAGQGLSWTWWRGRNGRIREVLQEIAAHLCIICTVNRYNFVSRINIIRLGHCEYLYSLLFVFNYLFCAMILDMIILWFSRLIVYFLCRLKINHNTHEFILEFGTVANTKDHETFFSSVIFYF